MTESKSFLGQQQDFLPKQALPNTGYTYHEAFEPLFTQLITDMIASAGPIPPNALIHDNACGAGSCTRVIMANPPHGVQIIATDIAPLMTTPLEDTVKEKGWPVTVRPGVPAQNLTCIEDNSVDLSLTSMALQMTPNGGVDAAKELYRTLKPGGVAVVDCFHLLPHLESVKQTFLKYKPRAPWIFGPPVMDDWYDGTKMLDALVAGGFVSDNIRMYKKTNFITVTNEEEYARQVWSTMGAFGGWTQEDENVWEEATDMLKQKVRAMPEVEFLNDDHTSWKYPMIMWIAVAKK
jgi:SAM-dependent methyltransferase